MNIQSIDKDGFRLPEYIPLDLWQQYLQTLQTRKTAITNRRKVRWALSLSRLHRRKQDLRAVMRQSIAKQWPDFYSL